MRQTAAAVHGNGFEIFPQELLPQQKSLWFPVATNTRRFRVFRLNINLESPMSAVLENFPGAQRSLFRRYHIGGCSSCGFSPNETLAQVCARNGNLNVAEVLAHIQSSHEQDAKILISPKELAELLQKDKTVKLVDVRSREEFEAVHIEGSVLLSQDVMRELMASGSNTNPIVVIDHAGKNGLDAAAYFMGHGLQNVRCLRGGIDAWAQEVDTKMRRYKLG
jgi:rhodanese-related sulfurtransferase